LLQLRFLIFYSRAGKRETKTFQQQEDFGCNSREEDDHASEPFLYRKASSQLVPNGGGRTLRVIDRRGIWISLWEAVMGVDLPYPADHLSDFLLVKWIWSATGALFTWQVALHL
jgi:hypothetical protein